MLKNHRCRIIFMIKNTPRPKGRGFSSVFVMPERNSVSHDLKVGVSFPSMKIYFAGSIRGGRDDAELYLGIIKHLQTHGQVLTEHIGDKKLKVLGEDGLTDDYIHKRDLAWVIESNALVAEVSTPSLGVGYEIGRAVEMKKPVLCIYRPQEGKRLSAMIAGCNDVLKANYRNLDEATWVIDYFFDKIRNS